MRALSHPTIHDVARRSGVSVATVSRVLNGRPGVAAPTRDRVLAAMHSLGYRPNSVARSLVSAQTRTLGLLIPDITSPFLPDLVRGAEDTARVRGYTVVLVNTDQDPARERTALATLVEKRVDGVVFVSADVGNEALEALSALGRPVILAATRAPGDRLPAVLIDNVQAAHDAAIHLIEHGHRRIGLISGPLSDRIAGKPRFEGYARALAEAGIPFDPSLIEQGDYRFASGYEAARRLLDLDPPPTAVFAASDEMAVGAVNAALDRGLAVPGDLAVMGFDGVPIADMIRPRLSTVVQPIHAMGARATERLLDRLELGRWDEPAATLLPYRLRRAASCGCPLEGIHASAAEGSVL
ncbi:MAG TPA: LacI family DNA-binding transcriptional regulator [Bacillota bacterium]